MSIEELYEILLSEKPSYNILNNEKEIFELIPELKNCRGFNQNNEWHIYDVYEHTLHVVDFVPANIVLRMTALFHDIGKPNSYIEDENNIGHFYGHWNESRKIFDDFSLKHNFDPTMSSLISSLIYYHDLNISKLSNEELNKLHETLGEQGIKMLYELKTADLLAQNKKFHYILKDYEEQKDRLLLKYKRK